LRTRRFLLDIVQSPCNPKGIRAPATPRVEEPEGATFRSVL
jgi:hypothetical protein